jgi:hypothetical protein
MYTLFYKKNVRRAYVGKATSLAAACDYLRKAEYGVVGYDGKYYTKEEELRNAKSKRSDFKFGDDNITTSGGEVSESSDRELRESSEESGGGTDSSESSSERDS